MPAIARSTPSFHRAYNVGSAATTWAAAPQIIPAGKYFDFLDCVVDPVKVEHIADRRHTSIDVPSRCQTAPYTIGRLDALP